LDYSFFEITTKAISNIFDTLDAIGMDYIALYNTIFLVIAGMIALGPIFFALIKKADYEIK